MKIGHGITGAKGIPSSARPNEKMIATEPTVNPQSSKKSCGGSCDPKDRLIAGSDELALGRLPGQTSL